MYILIFNAREAKNSTQIVKIGITGEHGIFELIENDSRSKQVARSFIRK
jgi:hypothetical protein